MGLLKPWHHFLPLARTVASPVAAASHAASSRRQWPMMRGKRHDEIVQATQERIPAGGLASTKFATDPLFWRAERTLSTGPWQKGDHVWAKPENAAGGFFQHSLQKLVIVPQVGRWNRISGHAKIIVSHNNVG